MSPLVESFAMSTGRMIGPGNQHRRMRCDRQGRLLISAGGKNSIGSDGAMIDAFGRARFSSPLTLFDSKQLHDNQPLIWDDQEISGASTTSTHDVNEAMTTIGVAGTTAGKRVRQTFMRQNYQLGKSMLSLMTGVLSLSGGGAGVKRSFGVYDDENGIFLQDDEGVTKMVLRSKSSGSVVDTEVAKADWNEDKLDGAGPSGVTLDITKAQILVIDYEWLGVGTVRVGFQIDGQLVYCHHFDHSNIISSVFMSTPNLPCRFEIENTGTGAAATLGHICATVISEGATERIGVLRYKSTEAAAITAATAGTIYGVVGIRLKTTYLDAVVKLESMSLLNASTQDFEWVLLLNPTITGTPTWANESDSGVQTFNSDAVTLTGGTVVDGGFVKSSNQAGRAARELKNALHLGSTISGTSDIIVLGARPLGASASFHGGFGWRELS